jgi:tetratricopeptide (TPR) repeat protein
MQLKKPEEAERFLREGLQANPGHEEILFELGAISAEHRKDPDRARNLWELALKNWRIHQAGQPETNLLAGAQILGRLAKLEEEHGRIDHALVHLRELATISPSKAAIQKWIAELEAKPSAGK